MKDEEEITKGKAAQVTPDAFILPPSSFILALYGTGWRTMRTRSAPTVISRGLPGWMGMMRPLTLISRGGSVRAVAGAADEDVGGVASGVAAAPGCVGVVVSAGGGALSSAGLAEIGRAHV